MARLANKSLFSVHQSDDMIFHEYLLWYATVSTHLLTVIVSAILEKFHLGRCRKYEMMHFFQDRKVLASFGSPALVVHQN
jgi:hypothetical protein